MAGANWAAAERDDPHVDQHERFGHDFVIEISQEDHQEDPDPLEIDQQKRKPAWGVKRTRIGMKMWLSSMVEIATDSTMTMPAAAEKPSQESQDGYARMPFAIRDTDDEEIRTAGGAGDEDSTQCYGYDEQIDQKQIGREHPHGFRDVAFVRVFYHHDMELPREEHDRPHGDCQHGEGGIASGCRLQSQK